jgi:hypothetical protein
MTKETDLLDLGELEDIDESVSKHIKRSPDLDLMGDEEEY